MRDIWAVVDGYDAEFSIHACFEGRADAERWAAEYRHPVRVLEDVRVERFPLYAAGEEPAAVEVFQALVRVHADGSISEPRLQVARVLDSQHGDLSTPQVGVDDELGEVTVWTAAWSEDAAIAAAMERVEQLRAGR